MCMFVCVLMCACVCMCLCACTMFVYVCACVCMCVCPQLRKPLFPGTTCFPLSADSMMSFTSMKDQLNVIFDVIGTPAPADIDALENDAAKRYLTKLPPKEAKYVC